MNGGLRDITLSLDQETIEFLEAAARSRKTSKSGFLRMVPTLLTPEERAFIERFRDAKLPGQNPGVTRGMVHVTTEP